MSLPTSIVAVFEDNRTRADLYDLWLEGFDVRTAMTKVQADETVGGLMAVAVLDQEFADGAAEKTLELLRSRTPACRVVATRERSATFPNLSVDHHLIKPVFEEELVEMVEMLARRTNYQLLIQFYYQTTISLASLERKAEDTRVDQKSLDNLRRRANRLQSVMQNLRQQMSEEDIAATMRSVTIDDTIETPDSARKVDSKYMPDECARCGVEWSQSADEPTVSRLAAHVWRCVECGDIQMYSDPSHQLSSSYRR